VPPALSALAFLVQRSLVNGVRRRWARLKEPRYLVATCMGAAYFYLYIGRTLFRRPGGSWTAAQTQDLSLDLRGLLLLGASLALAIVASQAWLFFSGRPRLSLSEADIQFLVPAPLPPRTVVHFALARAGLGLLFSSLVVGALWRLTPVFWQRVAAAWMVFAVLYLHTLGLSFAKARWDDLEAGGRVRRLTLKAVAVALLVTLVIWIYAGVQLLTPLVGAGHVSLSDVGAALEGWRDGWIPTLILAPFGLLLAPVFVGSLGPWHTFPAALLLLALHYVWVVRVSERYEEAALEGARRAAERAARRGRGRTQPLAALAQRQATPFQLGSQGRPELAITWKNLLSRSRRSVAVSIRRWLAIGALLFGVGLAVAISRPQVAQLLTYIALSTTPGAVLLALMLPTGLRYDLRADLEHASILRSWPISPQRLVAAELAAPWTIAVIMTWGLLGCLSGFAAGVRFGSMWFKATRMPMPTSGLQMASDLVRHGFPAILGLALFLPALIAAVLVIQNAAVLALPSWFPPGPDRGRGLEATGGRLLGMIGMVVILLFCLIPAAIVGGPVAWLGWRVLGGWALVPAGLLASVPVWIEVAAALVPLARLFQSFDPAREALA
jgi:ABC-2 type transport system permease protein